MELTKAQKDELADKVCAAVSRIEDNVDELHERLADLAEKRHGSPEFQLRRMRSESQSREPTISPMPIEFIESTYLDCVVRDGCRPACSVEELAHIAADPATRYHAILSWLTDTPDTRIGAEEINCVFSRQFLTWWCFRKSQWFNRGLGESEEEISACIAAWRRRSQDAVNGKCSIPDSDDYAHREMWKSLRARHQGLSFAAYKDAAEQRLRTYNFTRSPQWKENPRQQDAWTNWLEYISFEKRLLEQWTAAADSSEPQFLKSWLLLEARDANKTDRPDGTLEAAEADRDASNAAIGDFIRLTSDYKAFRKGLYYQRHRVEWAVKEARLLETELAEQAEEGSESTPKEEQSEGAESIGQEELSGTTGRRREEDKDAVVSEPQPKRIKREGNKAQVEGTWSTSTHAPCARSTDSGARLAEEGNAA